MAFEKVNLGPALTSGGKPVKPKAVGGFKVVIDSRGEIRLTKDILSKAGMLSVDNGKIISTCALLFYEEDTKRVKMIFEYNMPKNASNVITIRTRYKDKEKTLVEYGVISLKGFLKGYFYEMPSKAVDLPCYIENQEVIIIHLAALSNKELEHKYEVCEVYLVKEDGEYMRDKNNELKFFENFKEASRFLRKDIAKIEEPEDETDEEVSEEGVVLEGGGEDEKVVPEDTKEIEGMLTELGKEIMSEEILESS